MNEFTFYFKFIGDENINVASIYSFSIKSKNLKEAVKVWTGYVQSAQGMIRLTGIERNGNVITS